MKLKAELYFKNKKNILTKIIIEGYRGSRSQNGFGNGTVIFHTNNAHKIE